VLELSLLDSTLPTGKGRTPGIAVLKGPGGIGKSALALNWLDRVIHHFPDGQLYADLASSAGDLVAVEDVLGAFLRALGVAPEHVPSSLSERAALFRSVTAERALAVLLENAVSAAQVKTLLPASAGSLVAVTTRRPLAGLLTDGAIVVPVDPLDHAGAIELLRRHVGAKRVATESHPTETLIDLCAGFPIALSVVAAQVVLRPHRPMARLVDELRNERRRLDMSMEDDFPLRATFELSFRGLPPDAAAAYLAIGAQPGTFVSAELTAATNRTGIGRARRALDDLVDASLLDEVDDGLYRCHDLVRAHARVEADERLDFDERMDLTHAALRWHLHVARAAGQTMMPARRLVSFDEPSPVRYVLPPAVREYSSALGWLERHRLDLAASIRVAAETDQHALAYALGDALQPLFIVHRHYREAAEVDEQALNAAVAMGDRHAEASMRRRLSNVLLHLNELTRAQKEIDTLLRQARERGDRRVRAGGLNNLALLYLRLGRPAKAVSALEEAVEIYRELGRQRSLGLALTELGRALVDDRRADEAIVHLDRARTLLLTTRPPDPYNAARAMVDLARAHVHESNHAAALALLDDSLEVLRSLGSDYLLGRAHEALAEVHAARGDGDLAREHSVRADELRGVVDPDAGA
jgi:tetratricopeptide (TPR) repeat protein